MSVIPVTQELESEGSYFEASPGKKLARTHLKQEARYGDKHLFHSMVKDVGRRTMARGQP
jgi:hypothetical protein